MRKSRSNKTHQIVEYIPLMYVNCDERFELCPFHLGQIFRRLLDENVEHVEEELIGLRHDPAILSGILQRVLGISRPHHLDAQQTNLIMIKNGIMG